MLKFVNDLFANGLWVKLRHKVGTFLRMPGEERRFVCEAVLMLGLARVLVNTVPFRRLVPWLSRVPETDVPCQPGLVLRVRRAVMTAARNVPWNAACLPRAMAAKAMLARRGCGSSFHLGAGFAGEGKLIAHAWLVARGDRGGGGGGYGGRDATG
jgi:hypothetical protein